MFKYLFLILAVIPGVSLAVGAVNTFEVDEIRVDASGKGFVKFTTDLVGTPATCITSSYTRNLAFDTNEPGGRSILSVVLTAKTSGKRIWARGTGTCSVYGSMESWNFGHLVD